MAQVNQVPRVAGRNVPASIQKAPQASKKPTAVAAVPPAVPVAPATTPPTGDSDVKRTPAEIIQGAIDGAFRSLSKTLLRTSKWGGEGDAGAAVITMRGSLEAAATAAKNALTSLTEAREAGFAPKSFTWTNSGGSKKAAMAAGDAVKLGAKAAVSFADVLTEEELNNLVVASITKTGKVVVTIKDTNRMIGVFHPKAVVRAK